MAPPLNFKPKALELSSAFQSKLDRAPKEHTEALLSLYSLLQEAHDHGWLDAAHGMIAGADTAVEELARYAKSQESLAMMRNIASLAKILGAIDPDVLHALSVSIVDGFGPNSPGRRLRPSMWRLLRSAANSDVLRGAAFALGIVAVFGRAIGKKH
jgi:uncharacterized protein YjgD (DUF1641 family)